jgi:hypothetical protein
MEVLTQVAALVSAACAVGMFWLALRQRKKD